MQIVNDTKKCACVRACARVCVCVCVCNLADKIERERERFPRYRPYWIRKSAIIHRYHTVF